MEIFIGSAEMSLQCLLKTNDTTLADQSKLQVGTSKCTASKPDMGPWHKQLSYNFNQKPSTKLHTTCTLLAVTGLQEKT
jgi:hypothetical protein